MGSSAAEAHLPFDRNLHLPAALVMKTTEIWAGARLRHPRPATLSASAVIRPRAHAVISLSRALSFSKAAETASGATLLNS